MSLPQRVKEFVLSMNTGRPGEYTMCPGGQVTLYSSCFAVMTLHYTGHLSAFSEPELQEWGEYLNSFQDAESGYFLGPELVPEEMTSSIHDYEHVAMHLAAHVLPALSLLKTKPRHQLRFAHRFLDQDELTRWLENRDWSNAWLEGNNLIFIAQFLFHLRDCEKRGEAKRSIATYFEWLDTQVDPETGLWGTNGHCSPFVAMCGGYHQLLAYYWENREVLYKEKLIDTVLSLQHRDGGFSPTGGGGACEDLDAADILVNLYKLSGFRRSEIRAALKKLLDSILPKQMADGGFVYRLDQPFTHLGIVKTRSPANVSNMFATWFRVNTLALVSEILTTEPVAETQWAFNDICSMGWHRSWRKHPYARIPSFSNNPVVSVVMSVYNGERYLRQAIDSILNQSFGDFEFIIINDGSTDRTGEILSSYTDERLILVHQENMGLTKALNRGLSLAKGAFIARQDADDVSSPRRLEMQVAFMEENPTVGLLGSRFEFIDERGDATRHATLPVANEILQERLLEINQFCHTSTMFRSEVLSETGNYREFFQYAQDYDLWLRIAERYQIANHPDMLVQYRELPHAISSGKILLQSRYAAIAARLARQRRASGADDLTNGLKPQLPYAEEFPGSLQRKLTDYYSEHPADIVSGLSAQESAADLRFILDSICTERLELQAENQRNRRGLREKEQVLIRKEEMLEQRDEALRQGHQLIAKLTEEVHQKDSDLAEFQQTVRIMEQKIEDLKRSFLLEKQQMHEMLNAKEERIYELLSSKSWKVTAPLRAAANMLKKE